jgi:hypothetical protein
MSEMCQICSRSVQGVYANMPFEMVFCAFKTWVEVEGANAHP